MNSENRKTCKSHRFKLDWTDKLNLKDPKTKHMTLANLSIYYTWANIKTQYNNNKFKISAPTWNDTFDLPDEPYSISDIQDFFEFIIKKHETLTENPSVQIYPNKRIVCKLLTSEVMTLLGSKKKTLIKIKMEKTCQN